jgi:hypothetical protein
MTEATAAAAAAGSSSESSISSDVAERRGNIKLKKIHHMKV